MTEISQPITEDDLLAFVDGQLDEQRRLEVLAYLDTNPEAAVRVAVYKHQNNAMHKYFDPVLEEPIPKRLLTYRASSRMRSVHVWRYAAILAWVFIGGLVGWMLHGTLDERQAPAYAFAQQAVTAHAIYVSEVTHPVEVAADQEAHLVKWLSNRLGVEIRAPQLSKAGYDLIGGRLLPSEAGPAAQFMYEDAAGKRLTLYIRAGMKSAHEEVYHYLQEGNVGVSYWMDEHIACALSGELEKTRLLKLAENIYDQLEL